MATRISPTQTTTEPADVANGRSLTLSSSGPTGDWRLDVDRPPLGSLTAMLFRAAIDRLSVHIAERGGPDMRPSHLYILRSLYPDGASVTELADRCEVTKQAISQVVDSLEMMKLVKRTADRTDGRTRIVKLTPRGEKALAAAVESWGQVEEEWAALIGGPDAMQNVREAMFAFVEAYGDWHRGDRPRLRPVW